MPEDRCETRSGTEPSLRLPHLLACCLALLLTCPATLRAGDEAPKPSGRLWDSGRLLATAGAISLEGAGGGGLVPWASIAGYGSRDSSGASLHATGVRLTDFTLGALGLALGIHDRLEVSYQHQAFDTGTAGRRLGLGTGYTFEQDIIGVKLRLFGDLVADQDRWWPQLSVGMQHKVAANRDVVRAVGASDVSGTDVYLAASKLLLARGLLLNGTLRLTRANQFGLLGHGGDRGADYSPQFEGSAVLLVARDLAFGAELRTRPNNLSFAREQAGFDVFGAWFVSRNLSLVLAYVDLGQIANQGRQDGVYLSLQTGF